MAILFHSRIQVLRVVQLTRRPDKRVFMHGIQPQTVQLGGGDNGWEDIAEQVPVPALPQGQDTGRTEVGETHRYSGRIRGKPVKFKDFETDESG